MESLMLPALPTTVDPAAFVSECEAALSELIRMETAATHGLDDAKARDLKKAYAALSTQREAIHARKKEIGIAKCDSVIAVLTARAEEFDREADALRASVESAKKEIEAAKMRLTDAEAALGWSEGSRLARVRL